MGDYGKYWGYARSTGVRFNHNGWRIEVEAFEFTSPKEFSGKVSYRYRMSKNNIVDGVWTDKNPRARKFDTRYFTTMDEAKEAAIREASK